MKKLAVVLMVVMVALMSVGMAAAQDPNTVPTQGGRFGGRGDGRLDGDLAQILEDATGLDARELIQTARDNGQTLAEAITANGGDVAAVQAAMIAEMTERNPDASEIEARVDELLNTVLPEDGRLGNRGEGRLGGRFDGELMDIITEATGLDARELIQTARENEQSLAEVITANGGDVAAIEAQLLEAITAENPNLDAEQAQTRLDNFLNTALPLREGGRGSRQGGFFGGDAPATPEVEPNS